MMTIETKPDIQVDQRVGTQAFKVRLDSSTVEFLVYYIGRRMIGVEGAINITEFEDAKRKLAESKSTYLRLISSLSGPISLEGIDFRKAYGIDYQDFVDFSAEVEQFKITWPPLLQSLIQVHDALVEAGAYGLAEKRKGWQEKVAEVTADFDLWRTMQNKKAGGK